jgi:hypothetical protein
LVIEEISAGDASASQARLLAIADIPSLGINPETDDLAELLLSSKTVPANSARDALHIAIAAKHGLDYLLTWNYKQINNTRTRALVINVVSDFGLECPVRCSPEGLIGEEDA